MTLKDFSAGELRDELERRDEEIRLINKPQPLEEADIKGLITIVEEYINSIYNGSYHDDSDINHYICEAAVKAIYGKDIFEWIRENE